MWNTRFMSRLFSATEEGDEELTEQVANDIEDARDNGSVDTDEVHYENEGDGRVSITDKENGEVTIAERAEDGNYDLYPAQVTENLEGYLHPEMDGVTPGQQVDQEAGEDAFAHITEGVISPDVPGGGLNPQAGFEPSVEELAQMGPCDGEGCCDEEREFSVSTDNTVVLRIFSDQAFHEKLFAEVIESEETAKVGDLKIEKDPDEEDTVVVTDESTGDQAKITLDDNDMEVTELDSKNFSEESDFTTEGPEEYDQLHVVGVDPANHVMVDAPEYDEESAQELCQQLAQDGVEGVQIFDNAEDARDYAIDLLGNLGAETEDDIEEPVQAEYSDHTIYITKYYSNHTDYMTRLFSEAANDIDASQSEIEDAIESGEEIENDDEIITPVDSETAIVEDKENGEFTKVSLVGDEMDCQAISKSEAEDLTENISVEDENAEDDSEDEKDFSDIWYNDDLTKMFSEEEYMNDYMIRMFSDEADEDAIEDAIENGDQVENESEVITPVDSETAVVEDKETGEFTKATIDGDDIELENISEDEANELTDNLTVENNDKDEDEKDFSDIWYNDDLTKMFSEEEPMTDYMVRMFADAADESAIEDAIENGDQVENDDEVITPINSTTAVVEDKESGEFTKATLKDDSVDLEAISEDEADELTENLSVEDSDEDEDEKDFSDIYMGGYADPVLERYFADAVGADPNAQQGGQQLYDEQGNPVAVVDEQGNIQLIEQGGEDPNAAAQGEGAPSVEVIEDKALQAVNQIQQAAQDAANMIMEAKQAPIQGQEQDLQEAQFSEYDDYDYLGTEDTLVSWLNGTQRF